LAYKPAVADLLWEKNTVPRLISRADKLSRTGGRRRYHQRCHPKSVELTSIGPVHLAYNPSYSACFFSQNSIFLSKKSINGVFQPAYNSSRTAP
jgi:hypothetical protein